MLERLCIPSLLGEIKCYPHTERNKYYNSTFIVETFSGLGPVGYTSQVEEHIKNSMCHYSICSIIYYLLITSASVNFVSTPKKKN